MSELPPQGSREPQQSPLSAPSDVAPAGQKPFLLAEDNKVNQRLLFKIMEFFGYTCEIVDNGQSAVEAYTSDPAKFAAIFMDIAMPVLDGFHATSQIRIFEKEKQLDRIPIVALHPRTPLSGDPMDISKDGTMQKALQGGADLWLYKPFKRPEVKHVVDKVTAAIASPAADVHRLDGDSEI